jgi:hypothetical protein
MGKALNVGASGGAVGGPCAIIAGGAAIYLAFLSETIASVKGVLRPVPG